MSFAKENCLNEVKRQIEKAKLVIDALERVERVRTKSGASFKTLSRNFKNCIIQDKGFAMQPGEKELVVCYTTPSGCRMCHTVKIYCYFDQMNKEKIKHDPGPKDPMLRQVYTYDADEVEEALKEEIRQQRVSLEKLENNLKIIEDRFEEIEAKVKDFKSEMADLCEGCRELKKFVGESFRIFEL